MLEAANLAFNSTKPLNVHFSHTWWSTAPSAITAPFLKLPQEFGILLP